MLAIQAMQTVTIIKAQEWFHNHKGEYSSSNLSWNIKGLQGRLQDFKCSNYIGMNIGIHHYSHHINKSDYGACCQQHF